jgi:hypothetical protein
MKHCSRSFLSQCLFLYINQLTMSVSFLHEADHGGPGILGSELFGGHVGDRRCPFYFTDEGTQARWRSDLPYFLVRVTHLP